MTARRPAYVIGAGGHAKVVVRLLEDLGYTVAAIFDDDSRLWGLSLLGVPIRGPVERIAGEPRCPTIIAIGGNGVRCQIAQNYDLPWATAVHPRATVDPSVRLGPGTVVLPHAVVQVDSVLGSHVIVNTAATVDHDCTLGDFVHLAPGVHLAGGVTIGDDSFLGVGAGVIQGIRIGQEVTVGAGATVIRHLPDRVVAVGVPAKIIRSAGLKVVGDVCRRENPSPEAA